MLLLEGLMLLQELQLMATLILLIIVLRLMEHHILKALYI